MEEPVSERIGVAELESVARLLTAYREALIALERLPTIGRIKTHAPRSRRIFESLPGGDGRTRRQRRYDDCFGDWETRRVCRPMAGLFVRGHVRLHATRVARGLRLRSVGRPDLFLIARPLLDDLDHLGGLSSWRRLGAAATRLPVVSSFVPAASGLVVLFALGTNAPDSNDALVRAAAIIGIVALAVLIVLWLPSVALGFAAKRELFEGNAFDRPTPAPDPEAVKVVVSQWLAKRMHDRASTSLPPIPTGRTRHPDLPSAVIYRLERDTYAEIGLRRRVEFPVDLVVHTLVFGYGFMLLILGMAYATLGQSSIAGQSWYAVVFGFVLGGVLLLAWLREPIVAAFDNIRDGPRTWRQRIDDTLC